MMQMEKKEELNKLKIALLKKKQSHFEELTKKQKEILSKLEKGNVTKKEKARLLKVFKHADVVVQKLKEELYEQVRPKLAVDSPVKNLTDVRKEFLDKEIDLYYRNLNGEELVGAEQDLATLRRQINMSSGPQGDGYRGRGCSSWFKVGMQGSSRGNYANLNIDNRPKQILVSGYDLAQKDDIVAHFSKFGQVERIEEHQKDSLKLSFPTRAAAEITAEQGVHFRDKQLLLSWFTPETSLVLPKHLEDKDLDDERLELDQDEEELLLADVEDDDEDDAKSEKRSWAR